MKQEHGSSSRSLADMDHWRVVLVLSAILLVMAWISGRGIWVQMVQRDQILAEWDWRTRVEYHVLASDGSIVDADGRVLARSGFTPDLAIDVRAFARHDRGKHAALREALARSPDVDLEAFDRATSAEGLREGRRWVPLARRMQNADDLLDELRGLDVVSVYPTVRFSRIYPMGDLAGHVIGVVGDDGDGIGVERAYRDTLAGRSVLVRSDVDARGGRYDLDSIPEFAAARGLDVHTTLDARLQRIVERVLRERSEMHRAERAVAVVTDPRTGDVLAMAQLPGFDPLSRGTREGDVWLNLAVGATWEPGSTMKIATYAAALDAGIVRENDTIDCGGGRVSLGRATFRDTVREGIVPLERAFQISSNVAALRLGRRLGQERLTSYLHAFGVRQPLGLGLGSEQLGALKATRWAETELATISFGYGVAVSPLQLNLLTATIANDGVRMRPRIVTHLSDASGNVRETFAPAPAARVVEPRTAEVVRGWMEATTRPVRGATARLAAIPGVRVAVKTGTARLNHPDGGYYEDRYVSSITGFLPADDPRFVITLFFIGTSSEFGHHGGAVAGPAFAEIGAHALLLSGLHTDEANDALAAMRAAASSDAGASTDVRGAVDEAGSEPAVPGWDATRTWGTPDVTGLWGGEAANRLLARGIDVRLHGSGRVVYQTPAATPERSSQVELHLDHFAPSRAERDPEAP